MLCLDLRFLKDRQVDMTEKKSDSLFAILSHPHIHALPFSALFCAWDANQIFSLKIPFPLTSH